VAARPTTEPQSVAAYRLLEQGNHVIAFPLCAYTSVYYVLSRLLNKAAALDFLVQITKRGVRFLPFREDEMAVAVSLSLPDHEDACVAATALLHKADFILTRDLKDFRQSPVSAITPQKIRTRVGR
jgi:predicted nucleic acid-binding protein